MSDLCIIVESRAWRREQQRNKKASEDASEGVNRCDELHQLLCRGFHQRQ